MRGIPRVAQTREVVGTWNGAAHAIFASRGFILTIRYPAVVSVIKSVDITQSVRAGQPVIAVQVNDDIIHVAVTCKREMKVLSGSPARLVPNILCSRVSQRYVAARIVSGSIVDENNAERVIVLGQQALDTVRQEMARIIKGNDYSETILA